ncbi:MAG: response regulator transcription factor [Acidobacteria bacterium]|nr:response regulator transcription factor [Acidobacteriota bacterium]
MKLLLVEDSRRLQQTLKKGLTQLGFALDTAMDGEEGSFLAETGEYDVIVLDLMLPKRDGLSLLKGIRRQGIKSHVLILSAKDQVQDRIQGLEWGADDYLVKPFDFEELVARIRALLRRSYKHKNPWIELGSVRINLATQEVYYGEESISLTAKEFAVLEYLLLRKGRVVTRQAMIEHLYEGYGEIASNVLDVMVCNLRRKLGSDTGAMIETKRGVGYVII